MRSVGIIVVIVFGRNMENKIDPFDKRFVKRAIDHLGLVKIIKSISAFVVISVNKPDENGAKNLYRKRGDKILSPGMIVGIFFIADLIGKHIYNS